jgi:hypothetical protein
MPVRCHGYSNFISECTYITQNSRWKFKINQRYHNVLHHDNAERNNRTTLLLLFLFRHTFNIIYNIRAKILDLKNILPKATTFLPKVMCREMTHTLNVHEAIYEKGRYIWGSWRKCELAVAACASKELQFIQGPTWFSSLLVFMGWGLGWMGCTMKVNGICATKYLPWWYLRSISLMQALSSASCQCWKQNKNFSKFRYFKFIFLAKRKSWLPFTKTKPM